MEFDILSITEESSALKVEAGKISARKNTQIERHGVRRFENGKLYQSARLGKATMERLIADTKDWGGPGIPYLYGFAPPHTEFKEAARINENYLFEFEEVLSRLHRQFPKFVFIGQCIVRDQATIMQSSYGLDLKSKGGVCDWYFLYQHKGSGNMIDGYFGESSTTSTIDSAITEHEDFIRMHGQPVLLKSGRYPVLFVDSLQPIAKLLESFKMNKYEEGSALYSGQLEQNLFSDKLTIVDNGYDPNHGHFSFFDGEGVIRLQDLKLVEHGRFINLMSDLRFGKKFHRPSSGNGMRAYNKGVKLSPKSLRVIGGTESWKSIIKNLDRCLVVMIAAGGESSDLGEFSTPAQVCYVFERGEIIGQAPQLTIKTTVSNYLGSNLVAISSDGFTSNSVSACIISEMDVFVN